MTIGKKMMSYEDVSVIQSNTIPDVIVIQPSISWDVRGNIYTAYNKDIYEKILPREIIFLHDKFAYSKQNVLRGLHGDSKTWKLVSCVYGIIYEVVVDLRQHSPTYKKWDAFTLNSNEYKQVLIPPGFVNGYYVVSNEAVFHYKLAYDGKYIDADEQWTIKWNNPELNIAWPCNSPILQERDKR